MAKQHHTIEIFSANCPLCKHITDDIQIGKCEGCNQVVYDVNKMTEEIKQKMKNYGIKSVPTTLARDLVVYGKLIRGQFLQDLSNENLDTFVARYR